MKLLDITVCNSKVERSEGTCILLDAVVTMVPIVLVTLVPEGLRNTILAPEAKKTVYSFRTVTRPSN